jgi:N,N'-diacetyllegionaminate synthase
VKIGTREIGDGHPCYIIAEIGNNHNGDPDQAIALMRVFTEAGADAVKFQTFRGADIVGPHVPADRYAGWDVGAEFERWVDFLDTLVLPREVYPDLLEVARELGVDFISTATTAESAEFLRTAGVDAIKIASMDLDNLSLIRAVAALGIPAIVSTGMGTIEEIEECVAQFGRAEVALLHCVSNYPLGYEDANLRNIPMLRERFGGPVGFSDHSLGHELDVAAVALGASIIEKHVTFDRSSPVKAEHHFAAMPDEFEALVGAIRGIESALGTAERSVGEAELRSRQEFRRSIFLARDVEPRELIRAEDLRCIRPATSVAPRDMDRVVGARARRRIAAYEPFVLADLELA